MESGQTREGRRTRGRGRPPAVTSDAIAEAVLRVGFADLTFASVAALLGVGQATLYRHAPNRDELVRLGLDLAIRRTDWPSLDGEWRPLLERWALAAWHAWAAFPGAVAEVTRGVMPPMIVELSDRVGSALVARGFSPRNAVLAGDLVFDLAADSRRGVESLELRLEGDRAPVREMMEHDWSHPLGDNEVTVQLHAAMVGAIREDPATWFHSKLRIVLSGIERELAPCGPGVPGAVSPPERR